VPRYELVEGNSSKFWEIERDGCNNLVTFGRIGTSGQTQTKEFASEAAAQAAYEKLVREKEGKGYALTTSVTPTKTAVLAAAIAAVPTPVSAGGGGFAPEPPGEVPIEWDAQFLQRVKPGRGVLARAPRQPDLAASLAEVQGLVKPLAGIVRAGLEKCEPQYADWMRMLLDRIEAPLESVLATIGDPEAEGALAGGLGRPDSWLPLWAEARGPVFALRALLASAWYNGDSAGPKNKPEAWWLVRKAAPQLKANWMSWDHLRALFSNCSEGDYQDALEVAREYREQLDPIDRIWLAYTFPTETHWAEEDLAQVPRGGYCSQRGLFHDGGLCLLANLRDSAQVERLLSQGAIYRGMQYIPSAVYLLGREAVPMLIDLLGRKDETNADGQRDLMAMMLPLDVPEAARFCLSKVADKSLKKPAQAYFLNYPERAVRYQELFLSAKAGSPERVLMDSLVRAHPTLAARIAEPQLVQSLKPKTKEDTAPLSELPTVLASPPWKAEAPPFKPIAKVELPPFEEKIHGAEPYQVPPPQRKYSAWDLQVMGACLLRARFPQHGLPYDDKMSWEDTRMDDWNKFKVWKAYYEALWPSEDSVPGEVEKRSRDLPLHPLALELETSQLAHLVRLASWCDPRAQMLLKVHGPLLQQAKGLDIKFRDSADGAELYGIHRPFDDRLVDIPEQLEQWYAAPLAALPDGTGVELMMGNGRWTGVMRKGRWLIQEASWPHQPSFLAQALDLVGACASVDAAVPASSEEAAVAAQRPLKVNVTYENGRLAPETRLQKLLKNPEQNGAVGLNYLVPHGDTFYIEDDVLALQQWNRWSEKPTYASGRDKALSLVLQRFGRAALPGFAQLLRREPSVLPLLARVESPQLALAVAENWCRLKKEKLNSEKFLLKYPEASLLAVIPPAVGSPGKARDVSQSVLRLLAARTPVKLREVLDRLAPAVRSAVEAILATDPLLSDPKKVPKLPGFWRPAELPPVLLKASGKALPDEAVENLGVMLAVSTVDQAHPGLEEVKAACTSESLANFAWELFSAWLHEGANPKEDWAFMALGHLGDDGTARRLAPLLRAWPGEASHARAVRGLEVLALIGSDVALMHLNGIAQKVKFKGLQDKAREKMQAIAENRGLTAEELADWLVPDLGLEADGSRSLQVGQRSLRVTFDERLKPLLLEGQNRLADFPKVKGSEEAAAIWKTLKKDAAAIATLQIDRLEKAMTCERRWPAESFRTLFIEHPLLIHLVRRLVWGTFEGDWLVQSFRVAEDNSLADERDLPWKLPAEARVGVVHPCHMQASLVAQWGTLIADYGILQPFPQIGRELFRIEESEKGSSQFLRFQNKPVPFGRFLALEAKGWTRDSWGESAICSMNREWAPGLVTMICLNPGIPLFNPSEGGDQRIEEVKLNGGTLGMLSPLAFSELVRDVQSTFS
jgi:predicted DNA-binding WGR domain protein